MNIEQLKKIKALADDPRGIPWERKAARAILERMLEEMNKSESELEAVAKFPRKIKFAKKYETLVRQLIYNSTSKPELKRYKYYQAFEALMTDDEYTLFLFYYRHYKKAYDRELELFEQAFVMSNQLYSIDKEARKASELTPEEIALYYDVAARASGIKNYTPQKPLPAAPEKMRRTK